MNTHRQILMTLTAAVLIAAVGIFAGCKKDEEKVKATGVTVCPTAVMLNIGGSEDLYEDVTPSNADDRSVKWKSSDPNVAVVDDGWVTAIKMGETTITCTTNDGGFTATTTVIVKSMSLDDYATLVPSFYYGNMMMGGENVGTNKLITVKYHSENKVMLLVDEKFNVPEMGDIEVPMKVDCIADMTKDETGYKAVGKTTASMMGMSFDVDIEAIFDDDIFDDVDKVDMTIYVYKVPMMGDLVINFTGTGTTIINPCFLPD